MLIDTYVVHSFGLGVIYIAKQHVKSVSQLLM